MEIGKTRFVCTRCNYRFASRYSNVSMCPYCGGQFIRKDDLTAQRVLDEVSVQKEGKDF